jgi:hypothetical protein
MVDAPGKDFIQTISSLGISSVRHKEDAIVIILSASPPRHKNFNRYLKKSLNTGIYFSNVIPL